MISYNVATFHQVLYRNTKQKCMLRLPSVVTMFDNFRNVYFSKKNSLSLYMKGGIRTGELIEGEPALYIPPVTTCSLLPPVTNYLPLSACHNLLSTVPLSPSAIHCASVKTCSHCPPVTSSSLLSPCHDLPSSVPLSQAALHCPVRTYPPLSQPAIYCSPVTNCPPLSLCYLLPYSVPVSLPALH